MVDSAISQTEQTVAPERVSQARQTQEAIYLGGIAIVRGVRETQRATQGKKATEITDPGQRGLKNVGVLYDLPIGDKLDYKGGSAITVTVTNTSGQHSEVHITSITRVDATHFSCSVEGSNTPITLDAQQVIEAQILSEKQNILAAYIGDQRQFMELYFQVLAGGTPTLLGKGSEDINRLIEAMGKTNGLMTQADVATLAKLLAQPATPVTADMPAEEKTKIEQENTARQKRKDDLLAKVRSSNLIIGDEVTMLVEAAGLTPDQAKIIATQVLTRLQELETSNITKDGKIAVAVGQEITLAGKPVKVTAEMISEWQQELTLLTHEAKLFADATSLNNALQEGLLSLMNQVENGRISPQDSRAIIDGVTTGNIQQAIAAIPDLKDQPNDDEAKKKERAAFRKKALEIAGGIGGIGGILAIFALLEALKGGRQ